MGIGKSKNTQIDIDGLISEIDTDHLIEREKVATDKQLEEIREAKDVLLKIQQDLQDTIKAEGDAAAALKAAIDSSDNIINGICNAIVKAERHTQFKATIKSEYLAQLQQLIDKAVEVWNAVLENHCSKQAEILTEHEANMRKILRKNEGVWFSDFWMKVYVIFLLVYTVGLGLAYYIK